MLHRDGKFYVIRGTLTPEELRVEKAKLAAGLEAPHASSEHVATAEANGSGLPGSVRPAPLAQGRARDPRRAIRRAAEADGFGQDLDAGAMPSAAAGSQAPKAEPTEATSTDDQHGLALPMPMVSPSLDPKPAALSQQESEQSPAQDAEDSSDNAVETGPSPSRSEDNPSDWNLGAPEEIRPKLFKGSRLTVRDYVGTWLPATIVAVDKAAKKVRIHFIGWARKFNEWIPVDAPRFRLPDGASPSPSPPPVRTCGLESLGGGGERKVK
jgi:hypothetical protein